MIGRLLASVWRALLQLCFAFLSLRLVGLALYAARADILQEAALVVTAFAVGFWRPVPALMAYTALVFALNGLSQASFLGDPNGLNTVFASLGLAVTLRALFDWVRSPARPHGASIPRAAVVADVLSTAVVASLAAQLWGHRATLGTLLFANERPYYGFGDPHYFLTSAFLWLQGIFYFRWLCIRFHEAPTFRESRDWWVRVVFLTYGATLMSFFAFQYLTKVPAPLVGYAYYLPCEDISSFGSVCVTVLIIGASQLSGRFTLRQILLALGLICLVGLVIASWSRATWAVCALALLLLVFLRAPRKWSAAALAFGLAVLATVNLNQERASWLRHPYLARLIQLARIENPAHKSPERFFLYQKAIAAIRDHPLGGLGIGSFYLSSVAYARSDDPNGQLPDFAHNVFLQIAVELGTPVAAGFAVFVACVIGVGMADWHRAAARPVASPSGIDLGLALGLGTYVATQMTANSLNVYSTNQFLFWFLTAALLAAHGEPAGSADSARSP